MSRKIKEPKFLANLGSGTGKGESAKNLHIPIYDYNTPCQPPIKVEALDTKGDKNEG